jgi:hypothetical protein
MFHVQSCCSYIKVFCQVVVSKFLSTIVLKYPVSHLLKELNQRIATYTNSEVDLNAL